MTQLRFIDISTKRVGGRIAAIIGYEGESEPRIFLPTYTAANSLYRYIINNRFRIADRYEAEIGGEVVPFARYVPGPITLQNLGVKLDPDAINVIADMIRDRELFVIPTKDITMPGGVTILAKKDKPVSGSGLISLFSHIHHWHVSDSLLVLLDEDELNEYQEGIPSPIEYLEYGTKVVIHHLYSSTEGTVNTAKNYHTENLGDDWYIQLYTEDGPILWKERADFGTLEVIDGQHAGYTSEYYTDKEMKNVVDRRR